MNELLTPVEEELLLGRPVERLLRAADRQVFAGRRVAITGAGGSVGAELARQLGLCKPALLTLVDHSEHALFRIEQEIKEALPDVPLDPLLCDVTREASVHRALRRVRPHVVFHAAAYKHVTMAERAICAAARTNVLGTLAVMDAAREVGAQFVLISSDKAAAPQSVMGATKRLAELATLLPGPSTCRAVVRFGNVLASSGSFVDVMRDRHRAGRPIILTDPDATRYFMTVTEAAALVMRASAIAQGGETFWLDMGEQVRIGDLADRLLDAGARRGWPPVAIDVIGLRPGEKRVECLASQGVELQQTADARIWMARQPAIAAAACEAALQGLRRAVGRDDALATLESLQAVVTDFQPSAQAWATARAERLYSAPRDLSGTSRTA